MKETSTEQLFISSQVLKAVNITYRQLSYWEMKGIIKPVLQKQGTRDFKRYTQKDIDTLKRVKNLLDEGYTLPTTDTLSEITRREGVEKVVKRKLEFEKTTSTISSRFISVSDIGDAINASLADMGRLNKASRSYLFLFREDNATMDNTHEWCAEGVSPQINNLQNLPSDMVPWWMRKLHNREVIHIRDVSKLPVEAKAEKEILEKQDIKSLLVLPLDIRGKLAGFIGFDNVIGTGEWGNDDLVLLRISSEIIGNALERKKAEERLVVAKDYTENIIKSMTDTLMVVDPVGKIKTINKATSLLLGYKEDELVGNDVSLILTEEEETPFKGTKLEKLIEKGQLRNYEINYKSKDGRKIPVLLSGAVLKAIDCPHKGPIKDCLVYKKKGKHCEKIQGVVCVAKDITERKKAEAALRASEQKFKDLTETTTDWMWEVDKDGVYTYASPKVKELLGYEVSEVLGKTPFDLMPAEESEKICKFFKEKVIKKEPFDKLENINRHKDGHLIVLETSGIPLFDEKGQLKGYRGIDRDITERKKSEEKIEYLAKFPSENPYPVLRIAKDGTVLYANVAAEPMLLDENCKVGQLVPKHWRQLTKDVFASGSIKQDIELKYKDRTFSWVMIPITDSGYVNIYGMDITECKKAEEMLRQSEANYRELADSITDIFFAMDRDLRYTYWNRASEKLTGIKTKDAIGKSIFEIFPDREDTRRAAAIYREVLKTQQPQNFVNEYQLKDKDFFFEISAYPSKDGLSVFVKDITERKQAVEIGESI